MMDRELLLTELDASDAICSVRMDSLTFLNEFICHARTVLPERNQQLREALARIDELEAVVVPLERLRAEEGNSVEIFCPNPDFGGAAQAIEVFGEWTDWEPRRFEGNTLAEALAAGVRAMENAT